MPRKIKSVQDLEKVEFDDGVEEDEMEDEKKKKKKKAEPKKRNTGSMPAGGYLTRKSYKTNLLDKADPSYKME